MRFDGLRSPSKATTATEKFSSTVQRTISHYFYFTSFTAPPTAHLHPRLHPLFFPNLPTYLPTLFGRSFPRSFYSRRNYRSLGGMRLGPLSWLVLDLTELPIYPGIIIPAHIARAFPTFLVESGEFIRKFPRGRASGGAARASARI